MQLIGKLFMRRKPILIKFLLVHLVFGSLYANTKNVHFILLKQFRKIFG